MPELAPAAGGGSALDPDDVVQAVVRFLADAPPAWDPYRTAP